MSLNDPAVKKKIRDAMGEASGSLTRIEAEKDLIKEIIKKLNEDHSIPKKTLSKMIKVYHKQSFSKEVEEFTEYNTLYETIFPSTSL
jgi:hypothetical protein